MAKNSKVEVKNNVVEENNTTETKKEEKINYTVGIEDLYILSEIAEKINFDFPEFPDYETTRIKMREDKRSEREIEIKLKKMQSAYGRTLMITLFKSLHKAKDEINQLISNVTGQDATKMNLKEIKDTFTGILNNDGILDFFR